jgi:hypothetical protein
MKIQTLADHVNDPVVQEQSMVLWNNAEFDRLALLRKIDADENYMPLSNRPERLEFVDWIDLKDGDRFSIAEYLDYFGYIIITVHNSHQWLTHNKPD